MFNELRYSSAQAECPTDLLLIKKTNFEILMEKFPKIHLELKITAKEKVQKHV